MSFTSKGLINMIEKSRAKQKINTIKPFWNFDVTKKKA